MVRCRRGWLLAAALLFGLTGCWDRLEIEDVAYATSLAVDAEGEDLAWTFRIVEAEPLPVGTLTVPAPESGTLAGKLVTVRAGSLQEAVQVLQPGVLRLVSLEHLRAITLGRKLAEQGLAPLLGQLLRHNQVRRGVAVLLAAGSAGASVAANRPLGEINPVKMYEDFVLVQKRLHLSPPIRLHHLATRMWAAGVDPILPLVAVNPQSLQPPGRPEGLETNSQLRAGRFPRRGGNPLELAGTGVFREDRLVGVLDVEETAALLALRGEMGKTFLTVPPPNTGAGPPPVSEAGPCSEPRSKPHLEPESVSEPGPVSEAVPGEVVVRLHQENKPRYRTQMREGRPQVRFDVRLEAEVLSAPGPVGYTDPESRERLEGHLAGYLACRVYPSLLRRVYKEWGADPVGVGNLFRTRFSTFDAWLQYPWAERIRELEAEVRVQVSVRRYGLLLGPDPFSQQGR